MIELILFILGVLTGACITLVLFVLEHVRPDRDRLHVLEIDGKVYTSPDAITWTRRKLPE